MRRSFATRLRNLNDTSLVREIQALYRKVVNLDHHIIPSVWIMFQAQDFKFIQASVTKPVKMHAVLVIIDEYADFVL